ncbi:MAG: NADH:flavin oxidoreductase [Acidimicrobiia bacterium]
MPASPFEPASLGPVTLRNRTIKSATFEGMTPEGLVSDRLIEFHRRFAAGGVGMTTLAYCSVSTEGRTYRDQIWMRPDAVAGLRRLTDAVHAEGGAAAVQLGHAGWFGNPRASGQTTIGPTRMFSPYGFTFPREMTSADFARLTDDYRRAAQLAVEAGFDAVEVHVGHGYLLSQFLSPFTNKRTDEWGGPIENRARFPRQALEAVREGAGSDVAVYAKLNMDDGFRSGLQIDDGIEAARMIETDGSVDALELTGGFTARSPMYLMRGEPPVAAMLETTPSLLHRVGLRLGAKKLMREYPFEEGFFLPNARRFREAVDLPLILLGGIKSRDTIVSAIDEGFEFVAMARALLREPDLVNRYAAGEADESLCVPCNRCMAEMDRDGTRCVFAADPV